MSDEEVKLNTAASAPDTPIVIEWIKDEKGICEVYSNIVYVNWTLFDLRFRLGQIVADPRKQPTAATWTIAEKAAVTMPWGQAKYLRDLLNDCIQRYEKVNGELTLPKMPI